VWAKLHVVNLLIHTQITKIQEEKTKMDDVERRRFDMLRRVSDFGTENADDFPVGSIGATNFAVVGAVLGELEQSGAAQASGASAGRQSAALKSAARENVRDDLREINRTVRALALDFTGLNDKFRMPRGDNDQTLLAAARSFASDAAPYKNQFVEYGLPADFIDDLEDDIAAFEQAVGSKNTAQGNQTAATASIDEQIERGMLAVRRLNAIVANKYRSNPAKMASWTSASHVARPAGKQSSGNAEKPNP
jgi:hypothetical protein